MRGLVGGIKSEARNALKAEDQGGNDSKDQGGYIDDYDDYDGDSLEF